MLEALKKRIGETGEVIDFGLSVLERKAAEAADMKVPVLSQAAEILNPAYAGARAFVANVTSGGGKYYRPEVRDERHFSKAALRDLGATVEGLHGAKAGRAGGLESATGVNLANSIGGFSVRDGAVTDVFDINGRYKGVPQVMTDVARAVLGGEEAPDAGKVATRIPLTALGLDPAKVKAEQDRREAALRERRERPFREFERFNRELERLPAARIRTQQADRAGDPGRFKMSRNVLATDKVPKTIFGFAIVSERRDYTPEDLEFFRENPEAGGYYDLEDGSGDVVRGDVLGGDSLPDEVKRYYRDPATGRDNVPAAVVREWEAFRTSHPDAKGYEWHSVEGFREPREVDPGFARRESGEHVWYAHRDYVPGTGRNRQGERVIGYHESEYEYTRKENPTRVDPNDIKGTGVSFTDTDRVRVPEERREEYGRWLDRIAALDPTMREQRLVPPDWRTNPEWGEFQRDYDYGAAFMAGAEVPTAKAPDGRYHLSDAGKLPTHPTFSRESYYAQDPRWSGLAGEWTEEGNYIPGVLESRRRTRQAASGGESDVEAYVKRINAAVTDAIPFIKEHEGFRERAYRDSVGKWTVGYGQTEIDGRPVREGDTITEKDASAFVERRARENAVALYRQNPWMSNLSQGALSALYDVAYNLGAKALGEKRSPALNYDMQSADMDWDSIVWRELPTYVKAGGRTLKGLVNRRNDAIRKWRNQ